MYAMQVIAAASFAAVASAVFLLADWLRLTDRQVESRLAGLRKKNREAAAPRSSIFGKLAIRVFPGEAASAGSIRTRLIRAGIFQPAAFSVFVLARVAGLIFPVILALVVASVDYFSPVWTIVAGCGLGAFGMTIPGIWLDRRIRFRQNTLRKSMADFLDLSVICLDAGLSVHATIRRVADELGDAHPDFADELSISLRDVELGSSIDAAIRRFADRTGEENVRSLATLLREAQRFGTPLSDALRTMAESLRLQRELNAEEAAQKAAVKILLPTLLLIFPAVFVVLAGPAAIQIREAFSK